ncbi:hydrogenase iron-sulfur subunit [Propionicimonas sp.]|uniref:hydrogenase iron-sulfur subunit n=1 Tax=Propionicimonas sp. TaxID=1955623 RepID=UPI0017DD6A51|nr:hydrogenase iron-sulfur subunit [Propionicimonas sp.]MBU3976229.1 hydrogenase iron-sulfur subunit [Actinomycetota bacterium]MBA3021041.1 hydrogenase iron-sulfur subunit [Propionicimonas sp.]MBU3985624.1 hydrogenase iron-sulfur subunit [Actinomycetota bacterium]MBU4008409.1 hydrogenase iron-sulfur subunit [Actinomycetota bacterium]MBU4066441.1 hydrogenase iron-sulfur subunit [Actinomycetota bacterium]
MSPEIHPDTNSPRILVFSTINISDPGIDLAGSRHLEYPATVQTMPVPCSSGLKPAWLIHALEKGFDGVFVASDGEECAYLPDCAERTSRIIAEAQAIMTARGISPDRLKMAAVCSVCAEPFANYMREFSEKLKQVRAASSVA